MSVPHNILMDPNSVMSWIVLIDAYGKLFPIVRAIIETTRRSCILKTQVSVKGYKNTNYKVFSCIYIYIYIFFPYEAFILLLQVHICTISIVHLQNTSREVWPQINVYVWFHTQISFLLSVTYKFAKQSKPDA